MEEAIINKVASSSLINIDLEDWYPRGRRVFIDLKEQLFMGQILREKDFREWIKQHDWQQYAGAYAAIGCTADAIIPVWAYMLVAAQLRPHAARVAFGSLENLETEVYKEIIDGLDIGPYTDQRVIIKGCGNLPVPPAAYLMLTARLQPVAKSIMYGEACSTVPVFKAATGKAQ